MMTTSVFLTTPRLSLREFQLTDWGAVLVWAGDPAVTEAMAVEPFNVSAARAYVVRMVAAQVVRPRRRWEVAVVERQGGTLVGACGLAADATTGTLGYALARDRWGAGYATEAATALLRLGFEHLALTEVVAACPAGHRRSVRVLEKLGFTRRPARWWERWRERRLWGVALPASVWANPRLSGLVTRISPVGSWVTEDSE